MNDFITHLTREKERLSSLLLSIDNLLNEYSHHNNEFTQSQKIDSNLSSAKKNEDSSDGIPLEFARYKGYSLKESVKNVVLGLDRFTKATDILKTLLFIYPKKSNNVYNFQVQISGILSDLGKSGDIVKYQFSSSKKDTAWGKKEWLNERGSSKDEYAPKLK